MGYSSDSSEYSDSEPIFGMQETLRNDLNENVGDIGEDIYQKVGVQTYLRSLHWNSGTFNPLQRVDHFEYFPNDDNLSSDMFFEVFSAKQKKSSTNSMTQISLLNDKVRNVIKMS